MRRLHVLAIFLLGWALAGPALAHDTVYYYYNDAQGTPVAMTDANGNVVERSQYAPYGQVLNRALRDGPGYTSHEEDPGTGLVYMQQRYYDPTIGRFLSMDPVDANTVTGGNFNRYAYTNDNPYRYTDPDGRCPKVQPICAEAAPASAFHDTFSGALANEFGNIAALFTSNHVNPINNTVPSLGDLQEAKLSLLTLLGPGEGVVVEEAGAKFLDTAASRVGEIQRTLTARTQRSVTTAVVETKEGVRVISSSEGRLRPVTRAALRPGEVEGVGQRGVHAEINGINAARDMGLTPTGVAPSRPPCASCTQALNEAGIPVLGH